MSETSPSGTASTTTASKTSTASKSTTTATPDPQPSQEHVESAASETDIASLAKMAQIDEERFTQLANPPADPTEVVEIDGQTAARSSGAETGAIGQLLPGTGEVAGGNIAKVLDPPPDTSRLNMPLVKERAAMLSPVGRKLAGFVNRPPNEWGLLGPGDAVKGHMLLLDLNTGEKVRAMDGHKINEGQLFANLRNFPEALSNGDTIEQLLG